MTGRRGVTYSPPTAHLYSSYGRGKKGKQINMIVMPRDKVMGWGEGGINTVVMLGGNVISTVKIHLSDVRC